MKKKAILLIRVLVAMIVFSISGTVLSEVLAFAFMSANWNQESVLMAYQIGGKLITICIAFPLFILVMRIWGTLERFSWKGNNKLTIPEHIKYLVLAFLPVIILYGMMIVLVQNGSVSSEAIAGISSVGDFCYILIFGCLVMPLVEEIMFRGIMLHTLSKEGTWFAVIVSSVCFAVGHNNPVNMLIGLADGVVFALLANKSGGIRYGYFYHVVINLVGNILMPFVMQFIL